MILERNWIKVRTPAAEMLSAQKSIQLLIANGISSLSMAFFCAYGNRLFAW